MRLRYSFAVAASSTPSEERDLGNRAFEVLDDSLSDGGTFKAGLPQGAIDQEIALPNIEEGRFLAIRSRAKNPNRSAGVVVLTLIYKGGENAPDEEAHVRLVPLGRGTRAIEGLFVITTANLKGLRASNEAALDMELIVTAVGD